MIDIPKGRYWDSPWSLVDGCTPCSPGCDHCWALAMGKRFCRPRVVAGYERLTMDVGTHPERLTIPLKRRKPTVYAVWNDLFHEAVPTEFIDDALEVMAACPQHTFLVLSKRAHLMDEKIYGVTSDHGCRELGGGDYLPNAWWGLTVCNQQEMEDKSKDFFSVPGNKFLSLEPLLSKVIIPPWVIEKNLLSCVILGGETGTGARPMHPDWVRSVRDQCAAAGVPFFFFKQWGEWTPSVMLKTKGRDGFCHHEYDPTCNGTMCRIGRKKAGRLLDGRTHDDLPWGKDEETFAPSLVSAITTKASGASILDTRETA